MIHVMAVPGLAGTPVPPPVVSNHAIATLAEEQHLCVPIVGRERPAVTEDYWLALSPVLVVNLRTIFRSDRRHEDSPYRFLEFYPFKLPGVAEPCSSKEPALCKSSDLIQCPQRADPLYPPREAFPLEVLMSDGSRVRAP